MDTRILPQRLDRKIIYESDWVHLYLDKVKMPDGRIFDTYLRVTGEVPTKRRKSAKK